MVLIGPNDVGKSSLLRCLNLLLGASTAQLYNQITQDDLQDPDLPLSIEADLCEFSDDEQALFADEVTVDPTGEDEPTLTVRLEATIDENETLSINRTVPNKNIGRQISREQLRAIGWTLLNANDRARTLMMIAALCSMMYLQVWNWATNGIRSTTYLVRLANSSKTRMCYLTFADRCPASSVPHCLNRLIETT